jgi:hypothetical protein
MESVTPAYSGYQQQVLVQQFVRDPFDLAHLWSSPNR